MGLNFEHLGNVTPYILFCTPGLLGRQRGFELQEGDTRQDFESPSCRTSQVLSVGEPYGQAGRGLVQGSVFYQVTVKGHRKSQSLGTILANSAPWLSMYGSGVAAKDFAEVKPDGVSHSHGFWKWKLMKTNLFCLQLGAGMSWQKAFFALPRVQPLWTCLILEAAMLTVTPPPPSSSGLGRFWEDYGISFASLKRA